MIRIIISFSLFLSFFFFNYQIIFLVFVTGQRTGRLPSLSSVPHPAIQRRTWLCGVLGWGPSSWPFHAPEALWCGLPLEAHLAGTHPPDSSRVFVSSSGPRLQVQGRRQTVLTWRIALYREARGRCPKPPRSATAEVTVGAIIIPSGWSFRLFFKDCIYL